MKTFSKGFFSTSFLSLFFVLFLAVTSYGITYTTVQDGNWNSASTWAGGLIPPSVNPLPSGDVINIRHRVTFNISGPIKNNGTIRIQPFMGSTATLTVPSGVDVENSAVKPQGFYIINATYRQCRFAACDDGQSTPATEQDGKFTNKGGYLELDTADVEVAKDWKNESGGERITTNSCVRTGKYYENKGTNTTETVTNSFISVAWHGSGKFENESTATYDRLKVQLAGTSGDFKLEKGTVNGDIDLITLRNHVTGVIGSGKIEAKSAVVTTGINLDAYCVSNFSNASLFVQNGKFTGTRAQDCGTNDFPAACSVAPPSSAGAVIEGRVLTSKGQGISRVSVELTGGDLSNPIRVFTDPAGAYRFENISIGHAYIITVNSKKFSFASPSRVVTLQDNLTEFNFVADRSSVFKTLQK